MFRALWIKKEPWRRRRMQRCTFVAKTSVWSLKWKVATGEHKANRFGFQRGGKKKKSRALDAQRFCIEKKNKKLFPSISRWSGGGKSEENRDEEKGTSGETWLDGKNTSAHLHVRWAEGGNVFFFPLTQVVHIWIDRLLLCFYCPQWDRTAEPVA